MKKLLYIFVAGFVSIILAPQSKVFDASELPSTRERMQLEQLLLLMRDDDPQIGMVANNPFGQRSILAVRFTKQTGLVPPEQTKVRIQFTCALDDAMDASLLRNSDQESKVSLIKRMVQNGRISIISYEHSFLGGSYKKYEHRYIKTGKHNVDKFLKEKIEPITELHEVASMVLDAKPVFTMQNGNLSLFLNKMVCNMRDQSEKPFQFYIYLNPKHKDKSLFELQVLRKLNEEDDLFIIFVIPAIDQHVSRLHYDEYKDPIDILCCMDVDKIIVKSRTDSQTQEEEVPFALPLSRDFVEGLIYQTEKDLRTS